MWDFEHGEAARDFQIEYTIPSACAAALAANEADIGIIPAFTYAEIPELAILPNIAIAAKDRVRSILLVSKKPLGEVRTVAADTSSRTSVALLQVLFTKFFGGARELTPHPANLQAMLRDHDAALLIGDAALQVPGDSGYHLYDLAHLWRDQTGQAFVFAFWAVRLDALQRTQVKLNLAKVFQQSRDHGLEPQNLAVIAKEWATEIRPGRSRHLQLSHHQHSLLSGSREPRRVEAVSAVLPGDRADCGGARPQISRSGGVRQRAEITGA